MAYFEIFRGTQSEVDAQAIVDGQMLYTTDLGTENKIYADVGSNRVGIGLTYLTAPKYVYVATNGSDTTGDGTSGNPYKTIAKGLSVIPKNLNGFDATLNIAGGTYAEAIIPVGYYGGILRLVFGDNTTVNYIHISSLQNVIFSASSLITITINNTTQIPIRVYNSSSLRTNNINFVLTTTTSRAGLSVSFNSNVYMPNSVIINTSAYAVLVESKSYIYIGTIAGTGNNYGIYGTDGSIISYNAKTISATTEKALFGGSIITNLITMS